MTVRIGVVVFPGSNRDIDAVNALEVAGAEPVMLWHDEASLGGVQDRGARLLRRASPARRRRPGLPGR